MSKDLCDFHDQKDYALQKTEAACYWRCWQPSANSSTSFNKFLSLQARQIVPLDFLLIRLHL